MADSLPSPPVSRASTPALQRAQAASDDLSTKLDKLLEQYLELLDQYSTLQDQLSKNFSTGFFSLANAQRTANLGAGRRYGQEGYDGRMKASRRVKIEAKKRMEMDLSREATTVHNSICHEGHHIFNMVEHQPGNTFRNESNAAKDTAPRSNASGRRKVTADNTDAEEPLRHDSKPDPAYRDPASWFGLLVPQHLRQTQHCFTTTVRTTILSLVNTNSSMLALENEIWQTRTALGIEEQYPEVQTAEIKLVSDPIQEIDQLLAKVRVSTKQR